MLSFYHAPFAKLVHTAANERADAVLVVDWTSTLYSIYPQKRPLFPMRILDEIYC